MGISDGLLSYKFYFEVTKITVHARDVTFISEQDEKLFINDEQNGNHHNDNEPLFKNTNPPADGPVKKTAT